MAVALREGRVVRGIRAILKRPDGTRVPYPTPLCDGKGNLVAGPGILLEIETQPAACD